MERQIYRNTIMSGMEKEEEKRRGGMQAYDKNFSSLKRAVPTSSLFATMVNPEMKKSHLLHGAAPEDILELFEDVKALWETVLKMMIKRGQSRRVIMKESFRPDMTVCHPHICALFEELVHKFELDPDQELFNKRIFSDELIQTAILGMEHSYHSLENEILNAVIKNQHFQDDIIRSLFFSLVTFNEFFFLLAKLNGSVILQEKHLLLIYKLVNEVLNTLKLKLQDCILLLDESPEIDNKKKVVSQYIYYCFQTLASLAICEEKPSLSKKKYEFILEKFDFIFSILGKSLVFQILFNKLIEFEKGWSREGPCKYILTSFNQKRLSIYLMEYDTLEPLQINLTYVAISYYNNILKLIDKRAKIPIHLHSTNFLPLLLKFNQNYLQFITKEKKHKKEKMLIINENLKIIRSIFLHLEYSFDKLNKLQISTRHDWIHQAIIDTLSLALEEGFFIRVPPEAKSQLDYLNITVPIDFISLSFKALIRIKSLYSFPANFKNKSEALHYLNSLIIHLLSVKFSSSNKFNILLYKLYLMQFINIFSEDELREQYAKYIDEIYEIMQMKNDEEDDETLKYLRVNVKEKALDVYIKLSRIEFRPAIEATLTSMSKATMDFDNLMNLFYILSCVLSRVRIGYKEFMKLGAGKHGVLAHIFGQLQSSAESRIFVELGGITKLLSIYLPVLDHYFITKNSKERLDSELGRLKQGVNLNGTFFAELHLIREITEHTLPLFNMDFIERLLKHPESFSIFLHVLENMQQNAACNSELLESYVSVLVNTLTHVNTQLLHPVEELQLLKAIANLIESLTSESKGKMCIVAREILFRKAVLQMHLDIIQSPQYFSEQELFIQFLGLLKCIIKGNCKLEASPEWKANIGNQIHRQFRHLYRVARDSKRDSDNKFVAVLQVEKIFNLLLEIAFENLISENLENSFIIRQTFAIECFYQALYFCFKYPLGADQEKLQKYLLLPLGACSKSIFNLTVAARTKIPIILLKLLPHIKQSELQQQVSSFIGGLGSIHSSREQMSFLLKMMRGKLNSLSWKEESQLFKILIDTLVDIISGESISTFFYFSGTEKSYIKLQPSSFPSKNYLWVGNIRLEVNTSHSKQCIYSFLKEKPSEIRGVELYVENHELVYKLVRKGKADTSQKIIVDGSQLRDNQWHNIALAHLDNKLTVFIDEREVTKDCFSISSLPGGYTTATIGKSLVSEIDSCAFFGEISCLYFFNAGEKAKNILREIAFHTSLLPLLFFKTEAITSNPNFYSQFQKLSCLKFYSLEFQLSAAFIVDPRFHSINENVQESCLIIGSRNMNCVEALLDTKIFFNRPGKEMFANMGGFRTCFLLFCSRMHSTPADSFFCTGIFRILYALCLNDDAATIDYCMSPQGLNMIKHVLQGVARVSQYASEFVELFNILEFARITESRQLILLVPKLIENVVFNLCIWTTSEFEVQRRLMERIENYFERTISIQFSQGQPYKSILGTLYDYFSPENFDEKDVKEALEDIRMRLLKMVFICINKWGIVENVKTFSHFLRPDFEKFYSIRDLLSVILAYSSQEDSGFYSKISDEKNIFEEYVKHCYSMKEIDCDFLLSLFGLIKRALTHKEQLISKVKNNEEVSSELIDCCEEVIVYSLQILFSLNWEDIFSYKVKKGSAKKKKTRLFQFLKPKRKYINQVQTEDVIINFLFNNDLSDETNSIIRFRILGYPTFVALIGQIFTQPSFWINRSSNIYKKIIDMQEVDISNSRFKLFFQTTFLNIKAFKWEVQEKMLRDILGFANNPLFISNFVNLEKVLDVLIDMITDEEYFTNSSIIQPLLEVVLLFFIHYWKDRLKRDIMQKIFSRLTDFSSEILIGLADKIVSYFLQDPVRSVSEESIFNTTQLVYLLEDVAFSSDAMLNSIDFKKLMGKIVVYLSEIKLLYFWHPAILSQGEMQDTSELSRTSQREGGMVRVVLKLIMGGLLKMREDWDAESKQFVFNIFKYFLRHKHKHLTKICVVLGVTEIPSLKATTEIKEDDGFLGKKIEVFNLQDNLQTHLRAIKKDTRIPIMRYEESKTSLANPYESQIFRLIHVITQLCQIYVYNSFGIIEYKTLIKDRKQFELIKQKINITINCKLLEEMIAKLIYFAGKITGNNFSKMLAQLRDACPGIPKTAVIGKYSPVDFLHFSSSEYSKVRRQFATPSSYQPTFLNTPEPVSATLTPIKSVTKLRISENGKASLDEDCHFLQTISMLYKSLKGKKVSYSDFSLQFQLIVLQYKFIKYGLSFLHVISTEDYLYIDENICKQLISREKSKRGRLISELEVEMEKDVKERINGVENSIKDYFEISKEQSSEPCKKNNEEFRVELHEMQKLLLSEEILNPTPTTNIKCYQICSHYYQKLLKRCLLNPQESKKEKSSTTNQFTKREMTTDNMGRYMRIKPIKSPLKNPSVLKGVKYVKHYFLKKIMLLKILNCTNIASTFLFSNKYHKILLNALLNKQTLSKKKKEEASHTRFSLTSLISRTQKLISLPVSKDSPFVGAHQYFLKAEWIKLDYSRFGHIEFHSFGISFFIEEKDFTCDSYRLGPSSDKLKHSEKEGIRRWRHTNITRIMLRRYNLIRQAVEIFFKNNKSIFLVLFSEENLLAFFKNVRARYQRVEIIEDPVSEFHQRKFTQEWQKGKLTNFEYLMVLNNFGGRSCQDLSQYFVFPWIISGYLDKEFSFEKTPFRELNKTIAGITDKKMKEADLKYENTEDFSEGQFQCSTHYMPEYIVLSYLMRIQPYTEMLERFESKENVPALHFHFLHSLWSNILTGADANNELIPEYFYNPEIFININKFSFGSKPTVDKTYAPREETVHINNMGLPAWARNNHYFIFLHSLALEHRRVRHNLHSWIDLIFGVDQQNPGRYNMFKPLTSEKKIKEMESSKRLTKKDLDQIAKLGHNPIQLFTKAHIVSEKKSLDAFDALHPLISPTISKISTEKSGDHSLIMRFLPTKDKQIFVFLHSTGIYSRKQISKSKAQNVGKVGRVPPFFSFFDTSQAKYLSDPDSAVTGKGDYFITCRDIDNLFIVHHVGLSSPLGYVAFHKNIVTSVHMSQNNTLYTGDLDGVVAEWNFPKLIELKDRLKSPIFYMCDHSEPVISLTSDHASDMYVSAGSSSVVLRVTSSHRFFRRIIPIYDKKYKFHIHKVLLSFRGYLVILSKRDFISINQDNLMVYSINGEKIAEILLEEYVNSMILDQTQYFLIVAGTSQTLKQYCLVTLQGEDLLKISGMPVLPAPVVSLLFVNDYSGFLVGLASNQFVLLSASLSRDVPF